MDGAIRRVAVRAAWFVGAAVLGGGCDLRTKAWAEEALRDLPNQSMRVIDPWVELSLAYNRGTAFSVVSDLGGARMLFGVLALAVVVVLLVMAVRSEGTWTRALALGTIAGGAIGNGIDRILEPGVVDFIKLNYPGGSWPTFNVADALVAVGVALLLLEQWKQRKRPEAPEPSST